MGNKILTTILCLALTVACVGCVPLSVSKEGTSYPDADIDRKDYVNKNPIQEKEMEDLIAQAERAIKAMGEVVPEEDRAEMDSVVENKEKMKETIREFLENYPDVKLDTELPETEISEEAFTWINELLEEIKKEQTKVDGVEGEDSNVPEDDDGVDGSEGIDSFKEDDDEETNSNLLNGVNDSIENNGLVPIGELRP